MVRKWHEEIGWCVDGPQMACTWHEEIGWCVDGIFENACIGSCALKLFTKFFSLSFLRKKFFYDPFLFLKNVRVLGHLDGVAKRPGCLIFTLLTHARRTTGHDISSLA